MFVDIRLYTLGDRGFFAGTTELFGNDFILQEQAIHIFERSCQLGLDIHNKGLPITAIELEQELWPEFGHAEAKLFFRDVVKQIEQEIRRIYPDLVDILRIARGRITLNPEIEVSSDALLFESGLQLGIGSNNAGCLVYWTTLASQYNTYMLCHESDYDSPQIMQRRRQLEAAHLHVLSYVKIVTQNPKTLIIAPDAVHWEVFE